MVPYNLACAINLVYKIKEIGWTFQKLLRVPQISNGLLFPNQTHENPPASRTLCINPFQQEIHLLKLASKTDHFSPNVSLLPWPVKVLFFFWWVGRELVARSSRSLAHVREHHS
jgi:hypothetical protein